MKCENIFCVYQSKGECTVEEIEIDCTGMCAVYNYPNIEEEILEKAKEELLDRLDSLLM